MKQITCWYRLDERGSLEFNHIEDGRLARTATQPTPKQKSIKRLGLLAYGCRSMLF